MNAIEVDRAGRKSNCNTALLLSSEGSCEARYDKIHRVPFGEYVPLREWLPFMDSFSPYDANDGLRAGDKFVRFCHGEYRFGVLICYEDTDPCLARRYVQGDEDSPPVDFLVNISNDGWFHGTSEHEEHLAVSRFRAIECRRALVRAVNMGISAVIDGNGRVLDMDEPVPDAGRPKLWRVPFEGGHTQPLPHSAWVSHKHVAGAVVAAVPIDDRFSFYAVAGDWLPWLCWLLIGIGTLGMWVYGRLRRAPQS